MTGDELEWLDGFAGLVGDEVAERAKRDLRYDWLKVARPEQLPPDWDWVYWLILAGRGYGKTRTGAETVRRWVKNYEYVNLIGATTDDARDIMIEGESGILAVCPKDERPTYLAHKRQLRWPNGAKSLIFTADEPDRLRGKQHMKLWCDELCAWRYAESWDQAKFGLRLGDAPQAVLTTTPRPTKLLKAVMADKRTALTRGKTVHNAANLAPAFLEAITARYEGTRLGRQELDAEVLEDNPGALWKRELIDATRISLDKLPAMRRIVVGVDPSATANKDSDECGILVVGICVDGRGYVLEDASGVMTPDEWGKKAVAVYHKWQADRIVAEKNNGGLMVESTLRTVDRNVPAKLVHASKGKMTRAEPVSALYEQGKVSHVGLFSHLEDQMCDYDQKTSKYSPDRMDALVWALTELMVKPLPGQGYIDLYKQRADEVRARREAGGEPSAKIADAATRAEAKKPFCVVTTNH